MRILKPLSVALVMSITITLLILATKQNTEETYVVTLENGTTFEATRVNWYNSGIADIRRKDGVRIQIPTRSIKQVKIIEK